MWFLLLAVIVLALAALAVMIPRGRPHAAEPLTVRNRPPGRD